MYSNHSIRGRRTLKYRHIEEIARLKYAARWPRKNSARLRSISRRWATGGTIIRTSRRPPETLSKIILRGVRQSQTRTGNCSFIPMFDWSKEVRLPVREGFWHVLTPDG